MPAQFDAELTALKAGLLNGFRPQTLLSQHVNHDFAFLNVDFFHTSSIWENTEKSWSFELWILMPAGGPLTIIHAKNKLIGKILGIFWLNECNIQKFKCDDGTVHLVFSIFSPPPSPIFSFLVVSCQNCRNSRLQPISNPKSLALTFPRKASIWIIFHFIFL